MAKTKVSAKQQAADLSNHTLASILDGLAKGMEESKPVLARYLTEAARRLREAKP